MRHVYLARIARRLALLIAVTLAPGTAMAEGHKQHVWWDDPSVGYAAPIQAVYQFPAVVANQPGSGVSFLLPDPTRGLLGGQPYLYHP
jgi:hypothetical protein